MMMKALVSFSIRFNGVIIGLCCLVLAFGLYSLINSDWDVFPEFSPKQTVIQTESPGLSAELVESLVTQPIENSIAGTVGILSMRSQSIPGLSIVTVIFNEKTDVYRNRQVITERLATLTHRLPARTIPIIMPLASSASTVMGVGVTSRKLDLKQLRSIVNKIIVPHLFSVPGIADVNVFGGQVRQLELRVNPEKMLLYGVSLTQIENALISATGVRGNGFIENNNQRILINSEGQLPSTQLLAGAPLLHRDGRTVLLGDVGEVVEGVLPSISAAAINEEEGVYLSVQGQLGANTYQTTHLLEKALQELAPSLQAQGVILHRDLFRPANFIEVAINGVRVDIFIGSVLVVAVLFLFLSHLRTAFISATAIPLSLLTAVLVMRELGSGINIMVLGGLAIALGEVVDDAIIDTENIFRRLRENRLLPKPKAIHRVVLAASMEVRSSVVYATIIVVLVFLPLLSLEGVAGKLFAPLGMTYIAAIMISLLVALTLTPALCYALIGQSRFSSGDPPLIAHLKRGYIALLRSIEAHYKAVLLVSLLLISMSLSLLPLLNAQFIPALHEGHYILHMTLVSGTSERESLRIGQLVSARVRQIAGVQSVTQWVGRAPNGADTFGPHYSEFEVEIGKASGAMQRRILSQIREELQGDEQDKNHDGHAEASFVGVNFAINTFLTERIEETISGYPADVVINIYGNDLDSLDADARAIAKIVSAMPGATDVVVQSVANTPAVKIRLNAEKLSIVGIPMVDVLENLRAAYQRLPVTHIYEGNRPLGVSVTLAGAYKVAEVQDVGNLPLFNSEGRLVRLREVANIEESDGRAKILHAGGKRIQTVTANVANVDIEQFTEQIKTKIAKQLTLAPAAYLEFSGAAIANANSRHSLIVHSLLVIALIFLILYIAFGHFRNLLIITLNLPFALIGGVFAAMLSGGWVSLGALVGFVTLFGITLRNSIMLVSHYQYLVNKEGALWNLSTCIRGASERLPSIVMTALVTGLGLLPLALGSGEAGREIEGPMAIIIVGGLFTSTLLNLLILPTLLLHYGHFEKKLLT